MLTFPTDIAGFLNWIVGGGAVILAAVFASWYLETIPAYKPLSYRTKQLIVLLISGLISLTAVFLVLHPDLLSAAAPYLTTLLVTFAAWIAMQKAHAENDVTKTTASAQSK